MSLSETDDRKKFEERYKTILDSIDQGYFEIDLEGNLVFFNDSLCGLLGHEAAEMKGMPYGRYLDPLNRKKAGDLFCEIYRTGLPDKGFVLDFIRKNGTRGQVGASASLMRDENGVPTGFRGIARDISERRLLQQQLDQARKLEAIGRLASGIAHEISTPTQYVSDNINFLRTSFEDMAPIFEMYEKMILAAENRTLDAEMIREARDLFKDADIDYLRQEIPEAIRQSAEGLDRVADIVRAMKTFSHPGTMEKSAVDLNKAVSDAIIVAGNEWKYVAEIQKDLDPDLPPVPVFSGEFNQVILNMIINAVHAIEDVVGNTGNKGVIFFSTRKKGEWAEIRIRDTGAGIPEEIRDRLFDPFFTTKPMGKGTGQGLTICYSVIVTRLKGRISFESEKGRGTTFIIEIPIFPVEES